MLKLGIAHLQIPKILNAKLVFGVPRKSNLYFIGILASEILTLTYIVFFIKLRLAGS